MPGTPKKSTAAKKAAPARAADKPTYGLGLANKPMELDLPSGNTCLAVRPGAQGLIKAGLLDSLDQLTSLVQAEHIDSKDPKKAIQEGVNALAMDHQKILEGMEILDRAVAFVVREPKLHLDEPEIDKATGEPKVDAKGFPVYAPRDPEKLYADETDLEDRMFIFQWCVGGTSDLKTFRAQSEDLMGNISAK